VRLYDVTQSCIRQRYPLLLVGGYLVVKTTMALTTATWIQAVEESAAGFNFDLMILHLRQPQASGLELVRWVRQAGNPVPILIVSACASQTDIVLGLGVK